MFWCAPGSDVCKLFFRDRTKQKPEKKKILKNNWFVIHFAMEQGRRACFATNNHYSGSCLMGSLWDGDKLTTLTK
jgi:hypothetical protein